MMANPRNWEQRPPMDPMEMYLRHKRESIKRELWEGLVARLIGTDLTHRIKNVYYLYPCRESAGPTALNLSDYGLFFTPDVVYYSSMGLCGLLTHEAHHLLWPETIDRCISVKKKANIGSQSQDHLFSFALNVATDHEIEAYLIRIPLLKEMKFQELHESRKVRALKRWEAHNRASGSHPIFDGILDFIQLNPSAYTARPNFRHVPSSIKKDIEQIHEMLTSPLNWEAKTLRLYEMLLEIIKRNQENQKKNQNKVGGNSGGRGIPIPLKGDYREPSADPFSLSEKIKEQSPDYREEKIQRQVNQEIQGAQLLLENLGMMCGNSESTAREIVRKEVKDPTKFVEDPSMEGLFAKQSKWEIPFLAKVPHSPHKKVDPMLLLVDKSDSMSDRSMRKFPSCVSICSALIQFAAQNRADIGLIFFAEKVQKIEQSPGNIFWNQGFYDLMRQLLEVKPHGNTDFDKALIAATQEISQYAARHHGTQVRFIFLTDGESRISRETYVECRAIKATAKSYLVFITKRVDKEAPKVMVDLREVLGASLLRSQLNDRNVLTILKEFLK